MDNTPKNKNKKNFLLNSKLVAKNSIASAKLCRMPISVNKYSIGVVKNRKKDVFT
jgi:hypothetical protein